MNIMDDNMNLNKSEIESRYTKALDYKKKYESMKYDLEEKMSIIIDWENKYNIRCFERSLELCETALLLRSIRGAFISPAYNFNKYIDTIIDDVLYDYIKAESMDEVHISMSLRESSIICNLQNCLISIKVGLDRLVKIFAQYCKGFSAQTTFGHLKANGKATGFMSYVISNKDNNPILSFIFDSYKMWIQKTIKPRDYIVHYDDVRTQYIYCKELCCELPIHYCIINGEKIGLSLNGLRENIDAFYLFYNKIMEMLFEQEKIL